MRTIITAATAAFALAVGGQASATVYTWDLENKKQVGNRSAGSIEELSFTFNDGMGGPSAPTLSMSGLVDLTDTYGTISGGWFAISPGGDPKATDEQLAIFYMDFTSGRVATYRYDGTLRQDGVRSWQDQSLFIESYENAVSASVTDGIMTFSIDGLDVSAVQSASDAPGYTGVAFGDQIGLWFHLTPLQQIAFDDEGRLIAFGTGAESFIDFSFNPAGPVVPLPGAVVFAATGLAGLAAARRRARA